MLTTGFFPKITSSRKYLWLDHPGHTTLTIILCQRIHLFKFSQDYFHVSRSYKLSNIKAVNWLIQNFGIKINKLNTFTHSSSQYTLKYYWAQIKNRNFWYILIQILSISIYDFIPETLEWDKPLKKVHVFILVWKLSVIYVYFFS